VTAAPKPNRPHPAARRKARVEYSSPACMLHEFPDIHIKRIYDEPDSIDGVRVLVDRLWPRGIREQRAAVDVWARELAPSTGLRQWFQHDPTRWTAFRECYRQELRAQATVLQTLRDCGRTQRLTLLYAAGDPLFNHAVVLLEVLRQA
jgi:uncharacterized protein YeaO (DUF488 family)